MKYNYYYPDNVAEFQDYGNDVSCWAADDWDVGTDQFFQRAINRKERLEEAVNLIDDINEKDFIMDKEINQELYELGFIGKKDFVVTNLKDKIKLYEAEINKIVTFLQADLITYKRNYKNKDYAPIDIINLSDYLNTVIWQLCYSRDRLVGISHDVQKDISEQERKKDKGESNE